MERQEHEKKIAVGAETAGLITSFCVYNDYLN
jgi:hypothetical protein